jgi:c-di-GMP-binding flagellar brake protein YcgR
VEKMEFQEKRLFKRLKIHLPVTFRALTAQRHSEETTTKDISSTGLRMNLDIFFPPETPFSIKVHFPEINKIIEGMAKIVWCQRISLSEQYQAGLRFYDINPVFKNWLEEYILINENHAA